MWTLMDDGVGEEADVRSVQSAFMYQNRTHRENWTEERRRKKKREPFSCFVWFRFLIGFSTFVYSPIPSHDAKQKALIGRFPLLFSCFEFKTTLSPLLQIVSSFFASNVVCLQFFGKVPSLHCQCALTL